MNVNCFLDNLDLVNSFEVIIGVMYYFVMVKKGREGSEEGGGS